MVDWPHDFYIRHARVSIEVMLDFSRRSQTRFLIADVSMAAPHVIRMIPNCSPLAAGDFSEIGRTRGFIVGCRPSTECFIPGCG